MPDSPNVSACDQTVEPATKPWIGAMLPFAPVNRFLRVSVSSQTGVTIASNASPGLPRSQGHRKDHEMGKIITKDGTEIYYRDWGRGQPVVFSHGWPLTGDALSLAMSFSHTSFVGRR
jgi:hypothetical protein